MSSFLSGLLDRALNQGTVLQRRKPSQFEPNEQGLPMQPNLISSSDGLDGVNEPRLDSDERTISGFMPTQQLGNFRDGSNSDKSFEFEEKPYGINALYSDERTISGFRPTQQLGDFRGGSGSEMSFGLEEKPDEINTNIAYTVPKSPNERPNVNQLDTIRECYGERDGNSPFYQTNSRKQVEEAEDNKIQTAWNFSDSKGSNEALGLKQTVEQDGAESSTNFIRDPLRFEQPGSIKEGFVEEWLLHPLGQDSLVQKPASPNKRGAASLKLEDANLSQIEINTQKREPVNSIAQSKEPQQAIPVRQQVHPVRVIRSAPSVTNPKESLASQNTAAILPTDSKTGTEVLLGIKPKRQSALISGKDIGAISWPRNQSKLEISKLETLEGEANHQPIIHVSIGRIEIRANPSNAQKKADQQRSGAPTMKLEDYLKQREGGSR